MASNFLALVAERVAEKIAEQIAQEIPGAVKAVADSIIAEIGSVTEGVSKAIVSESAVSGSPNSLNVSSLTELIASMLAFRISVLTPSGF